MSDRDPSKASESIQRSLANRETIAPSGLEDSTPTGSGPFTALPSQFGRYRVTKLLGRGAMGTVYLAHDPDLGKDVALKVPKFSGDEDPVLLERFRREARAAGDLNHANICGVYEVGQISTTHFISMEYIDGRPLSDYISPDLPPRKIAILVRRLALALAQAHDRGIVHRDLKPANIMVNLQGEPVIMDFGLARRLEASGDVRATQSGMIVGSPAYMSPEQARGENDQIGPWTDIYGLGTLFFELLTGSLPFRGPMLSVLGQLVTQPPPKPSSLRADVDPKLESLCLKMLEKKPQHRPASMTEVAGTLTEWLKPATAKSEPAIALVEEPVALVPTKPAAPRADKADAIEAQKQRVTDLLDKHQYGAAIELLEKMTNLRDARFEKLVAWAKPKLKEVRATEQKLREASAPMCDTAQQLLKHYDYTGAAELLAQVPPAYRSIELRDLLEKVTDLRDECDHLQRDIEDAVRTGDTETLPALVKRLYKLRPNNKAIKQLYADLKEYGAAKVIARRKGQRRFLDPAGRVVEPQHIVIGIVLVVGLFVGVSLMAWNYFARKPPTSSSVPAKPIPSKSSPPMPTPVPASEPLSQSITSKSTGMKLALIPRGTFPMGSPESEADRRTDEGPQHSVNISQPFYMGVYEVTQAEYESVMGANPNYFSKTGAGSSKVSGQDTGKFPVESISWFDAVEFCNKLSTKDGLTPLYTLTNVQREGSSIKSATVSEVSRAASAPGLDGYRLPTEAEWEYAARANTTTSFHFGSTLNGDNANVDGNFPYGATTKGKYLERTTTVGSYSSNAFGLFDMHGNVREWCFDVFDEKVYGQRSGTMPDPKVTSGSGYRVLRGGSWFNSSWVARSADRTRLTPDVRNSYFGFRVVLPSSAVRTPGNVSEAASTAPAPLVYLDDLKETTFRVGWGNTIGKHGIYKETGAGDITCPRFNGEKVVHSLFIHPPNFDFSFVNYELNGQYTSFKTTVYNESAKPLKFEVLGDSVSLWESTKTNQSNKKGSTEDCKISVNGVKTLQLRVHCNAALDAAWGWWIDPCLSLGDVNGAGPMAPKNGPASVVLSPTPTPNPPVRLGATQVGIKTAESGGRSWKYKTTNPGKDWNKAGFVDKDWSTGRSGFGTNTGGYVYGLKAETPWKTPEIWLRTTVDLPKTINKSRVIWSYYHDDAIDIYVNGQLLLKKNGYITRYETSTDESGKTLLKEGTNVIAVHCRNAGLPSGVDVGFTWQEVK